MTNNMNDDFDDDFQEAQVQPGPAKKPGMAGNLANAWRGSPLFKLFVLVIGAGALATAIIALLSGNEHDKGGVSVGSVPGVSAVPGSKAPPAYVDAVNDASKKRAEEAIKDQKSALPTPVSGDVTTAGVGPEDKESQYDPLAEFRPNIPPENTVTQAPNQEPVETIDSDLMAKMQQQMTLLFESWKPGQLQQVQIVDPASLMKAEAQRPSSAAANGKVLIPAGTIGYAQLVVEANSDIPGPILGEVMSGPFTGAKVIGQFETTRDYLILHFTKLTYHKRDYGIDAVAVDPNTTLTGMVTEKDNRYFTRLILPAAAGFLEGFGSALSSSGTTSVVAGNGSVVTFEQGKNGVSQGLYRGISSAASTAGGFFRDEAAATKPLIRVGAGTPMGLFFVNSMTEGTGNSGVIETPVITGSPQQAGPPLPPLVGTTPLIMNPAGVTTNNGSSQSSLANGGVSIIQNTPR